MAGRVIGGVEVDAERNRYIGLLGGRGDDHLLGAGGKMLGGVVASREEAGRLDHNVNAEIAPGQGRWIALGEHLDLDPIHRERALAGLHGSRKATQDRVVLEEVGQSGRVG